MKVTDFLNRRIFAEMSICVGQQIIFIPLLCYRKINSFLVKKRVQDVTSQQA